MATLISLRRWTMPAGPLAAMLMVCALAGCATKPPPPVTSSTAELPFDQALAQAADGLVMQTQVPKGLLKKAEPRRGMVVDPMIDAGSAQQTVATQVLQDRVVDHLRARADAIEVLPFDSGNLQKARFLMTGTMTRLAVDQPRGPLRIDLALTELASGNVVAQSSAVTRDEGLDHTPTPYYQDIPVPAKDRVVESYIRTTATPVGQRADAYYLEHVAAAPLIKEATGQYNERRYEEALASYNGAGALPSGDQLRVLNGIYLTSARLGRTNEAQQAFGKLVSYGITNRQLGVKFLFNPDSTVFWSDPNISAPYPMWLREIARASADADVCVDIVGHASHTGTEAYNDNLSLQRARFIRQKLIAQAPALAKRSTPSGMGFRENIVGSGTDDVVDALDRRVEFKIVECKLSS
ncbi:MAG: OmpA family protein [Gammaproteobacteria bacterium]|nr:OmpA family protein [Gammaproteobacteria bacterium]MBU1441733.1 OmpA family protein [Gammaproteobacteria bacterium]